MSQPQIKPRLKAQRIAGGRISGLGRSPSRVRFSTPIRSPSPAVGAASPQPSTQPQKPDAPTCRRCGASSFEDGDGATYCTACGAVHHDTGNYSSEITFAEGDSGRAQQVGTRVSDGQTHQRNFSARGAGHGHAGHEAMPTSDRARAEAQAAFQTFGSGMNIDQQDFSQALNIFQLAYGCGFVRGRTIQSVALVSLYLALRRRNNKDKMRLQGTSMAYKPRYGIMLIDLAERANINVFDLGRMMQDMVKRLYLNTGDELGSRDASLLLSAPGAEILIEKFVDHLDFGSQSEKDKISNDAAKILQRMRRDWLHDGRRPSGVCGAAVIIAARMNGYRRTLREVVLCAKVTEFTVGKRLEEFQETASSKLSVNEFRDDEMREAQEEMNPPAFTRGLQPKGKKKRGRSKKNSQPETAAEIEGGDEDQEEDADADNGDEEPPQKRARIDADGFAIPGIPASSSQPSTPQSEVRRGRGKPKGAKNWVAPPPTDAEVAYEAEMQNQIQEALDTNRELDVGRGDQSTENSGPEPTLEDVAVYQHDTHPRNDPPGPTARSNEGNSGNVSLDPILGDTEFDDDPEVSTCLLNEAERALKEKIWVTENAEWLRQDHAKRIRRELKDQHLREQGIDPDELRREKGKQNLKRKDGARRSGRVGDVRYLNDSFHRTNRDGSQQAGAGEPEGGPDGNGVANVTRSATDSVGSMLKQRGMYSRRVNYQNLLAAYEIPTDSASLSPSRSPSRDRDAREDSVGSAAPSQVEDGSGDPSQQNGLGDFFLGNRKSIQRSKSSTSIERGDARIESRASGSASASRSRSRSPADTTAAHSPTPEVENIATDERNKYTTDPRFPMPTPPPTQSQSQSQPQPAARPQEEALSDRDPDSDTEIGLATPSTQPQHLNLTKPSNNEVNEDEIESDEDDYVDDDDDEEGGDGVIDAALAGQYGDWGEEEIVDDD